MLGVEILFAAVFVIIGLFANFYLARARYDDVAKRCEAEVRLALLEELDRHAAQLPSALIVLARVDSSLSSVVDSHIHDLEIEVTRRVTVEPDEKFPNLRTTPQLRIDASVGPLISFSDALFIESSEMPIASARAVRIGSLLPTFLAIALAAILATLRAYILRRYRDGLRREYEAYERYRVQLRYRSKARLDVAESLIQDDDIAKAIVLVSEIIKQDPEFGEASRLKQLLTSRASLHGVGYRGTQIRAELDRESARLYLRVLGTNFAYEAPPGFDSITVGRQRRSPNGASGCDVVVRVPSSQRASLRISREHLSLRRIGDEYFVTDTSGGGTVLSGRRLTRGEPNALRDGDRLILADAITLEAVIRRPLSGVARHGSAPVETPGGAILYASIGDMVTELEDD